MINLGVIKWEVQLTSYKINNKKIPEASEYYYKLLYHSMVLLNNIIKQ